MTTAPTADAAPETSAAKPRRSSRVKDVRFNPTAGVPLAQAAALALGIMRHLRVNTWAQVQYVATHEHDPEIETQRALLAGITLEDEQQALLTRYSAFLPFLRLNPTVTLAICPQCFAVEADEPASPGGSDQPADGTQSADEPDPVSPVRAHGWSVVARTVPTKCRLTPGCDVKPVKVAAATKVDPKAQAKVEAAAREAAAQDAPAQDGSEAEATVVVPADQADDFPVDSPHDGPSGDAPHDTLFDASDERGADWVDGSADGGPDGDWEGASDF